MTVGEELAAIVAHSNWRRVGRQTRSSGGTVVAEDLPTASAVMLKEYGQ